jgi:hypothetical protein
VVSDLCSTCVPDPCTCGFLSSKRLFLPDISQQKNLHPHVIRLPILQSGRHHELHSLATAIIWSLYSRRDSFGSISGGSRTLPWNSDRFWPDFDPVLLYESQLFYSISVGHSLKNAIFLCYAFFGLELRPHLISPSATQQRSVN